MRDIIKGRGFVMLSHYGLVKVLRVEAYVEHTMRLAGVCKGKYPFGWLGDRGNHTLVKHIIEGALDLFQILCRYLPPGVLDRGDGRVILDGIGTRHVAYCIEGVWEGSLQGNDVLDHYC